MKSPKDILKVAHDADPALFRQMAATAQSMQGNPAWARLKRYCDGLVDRDGLSFAPTHGATAIDPLLAALREGAKLYPMILEALADAGDLEDYTEGNSGVEVDLEP